jgi:hypothetical protein
LFRILPRAPPTRVRLDWCGGRFATGSLSRLSRQVEAALAAQEILFVKVNPRQARRFAEAVGKQGLLPVVARR